MYSQTAALIKIETAVERARTGAHARACEQADEIAAAFPEDLNIVYKAGVTSLLAGRAEKATEYFCASLKLKPDFLAALLQLGDAAWDAMRYAAALDSYVEATRIEGAPVHAFVRASDCLVALSRAPEAVPILLACEAANPDDVGLALALGRLLVYNRRREEALPRFARVSGRFPDNEDLRYFYLDGLNNTGRYRTLLDELARVPPQNPALQFHAGEMQAHATLALHFDRPALVARAAAREMSSSWLASDVVFCRIRDAVDQRRGFALTRHGDGEGRFLAATSTTNEYGLSAEQKHAIGAYAWQNWFGGNTPEMGGEALALLRSAYLGAIGGSDILGISNHQRLSQTDGLFGYLAALECTVAGGPAEQHYADAFINMSLHRKSSHYGDLIAHAPFLSVIGPHEQLAERLASRFDIASSRTYLVPGEARLPAAARRLTGAPHWPDRFHQLQREIDVPCPGAVFIVAAGLLGKIYCGWIKQRGGIAIDAGSVVDAWSGYDTRSGLFGDVASWAL